MNNENKGYKDCSDAIGIVFRKGGESTWGTGLPGALPIRFDDNDPVKIPDNDSYVLLYGDIDDSKKAINATLNRSALNIKSAIRDIQSQRKGLSNEDAQKIVDDSMAYYDSHNQYGEPFLCVLFFKSQTKHGQDDEENAKQSVATFGHGIENMQGRNGLRVFGKAGVSTLLTQFNALVAVFPKTDGSCGIAVAITDQELLENLENDLARQLEAVESIGFQSDLGKVTGDAKRTAGMLKKMRAV